MAYAVANSTHGTSSGTTTVTIPSTTLNNLGIFAASFDHSSTGDLNVPTGWTRIGNEQTDGGDNQDATWFFKILSAAETSISWTGGWLSLGWAYAEFSGVTTTSPLDVENSTKPVFTSGTLADGAGSTAITPAGSGELILSAIYSSSGQASTNTAGTGYALAVAEPGTATTGGAAIEWATGGAGSQSATWTCGTSGQVIVQIAAFKSAVAAAASTNVLHSTVPFMSNGRI